MDCGAGAFGDGVGSVRVDHCVERFAQLYQAIYQQLGSLVVHVIVARTMNNEQVALEPLGEIDRRTLLVPLRVLLRS